MTLTVKCSSGCRPILLDDKLTIAMLKAGVSRDVMVALSNAMENSCVDPYAHSHARGIYGAHGLYGVDGVRLNVLYMLGNLGKWQGEEARVSKKVLKRWALEPTT